MSYLIPLIMHVDNRKLRRSETPLIQMMIMTSVLTEVMDKLKLQIVSFESGDFRRLGTQFSGEKIPNLDR